MNWRTITSLVARVALMLLGSLWLLQGAGLVHVRPISCVTNCRPVTSGSAGWLAAGISRLRDWAAACRRRCAALTSGRLTPNAILAALVPGILGLDVPRR